jgi:hypothetical protein
VLTTCHLYPLKVTLTSQTSGGLSVGIVLSWTQATEFVLFGIMSMGREKISTLWLRPTLAGSHDPQMKVLK